MNTLKLGLVILVSAVFLAVVSIGGAQAATTIRGSKSNTSFITDSDSSGNAATTINTSKSNTYRGQAPQTDSINLNSSRSNIYRIQDPKKK